MTRLLVSVRDVSEVAAALAGGADIIDVKDPSRGAMGMADAAVIAAVCATCAGKAPVSVALGELLEQCPGVSMPPGSRPAHVKLGLAGVLDAETDWHTMLDRALAGAPQPIAVAYADHGRARAPRPDDVLDWVLGNSFAAGLLIDTAVKDGSCLFDWMTEAQLAAIIDRARYGGRLIALAGSLREESFAKAASLGADIVGVRGAACDTGGRLGRVTISKVADLAHLIATRGATLSPI